MVHLLAHDASTNYLQSYPSKMSFSYWDNYGDFTTPIGVPEVVKEGDDITVVSYGSTFNLCYEASKELEKLNIFLKLTP